MEPTVTQALFTDTTGRKLAEAMVKAGGGLYAVMAMEHADSASASATAAATSESNAATSATTATTAATTASTAAASAEESKNLAFATTPAGYEAIVADVNSHTTQLAGLTFGIDSTTHRLYLQYEEE